MTHYIIKRPKTISPSKWEDTTEDIKKLTDELKNTLAGSSGNNSPEISDEVICFNGIKGKSGADFEFYKHNDHEPFYIKTDKKPYDLAVCCALLVLKHHLKKHFHFETQGDAEYWKDAFSLYRYLYDRPVPHIFKGEKKQLNVQASLNNLSKEDLQKLKKSLDDVLAGVADNHYISIS
jgi:hypothetical protein